MALFLIAAATAVPVELRPSGSQFISWSLDPLDFALNVLLFVPFGAALAERRWYVVILVSALLSCAIELLQLTQAGRHAGPADVLANMSGGLLGSLLARFRTGYVRVDSGTLWVNRNLLLIAAATTGTLPLLAIALPGMPHDFSNWDATYQLAISDEITRDRSWTGTLIAWAIYDRPLERDDLRDLARSPLLPGDSVDPAKLPANPVSSWQNPDPETPPGYLRMGPEMSATVYQRLVATGEMSLLSWIRVKDLEQTDVERIVTFSRDPFHRNFTLGQEAGTIEFRLRTPATGLNGTRPYTTAPNILEPGRSYFVAATYDGFVSRIFVDGELVGRQSLAAKGAALPALQDGNLPPVLAVCGGCFAALLVALRRRPSRASIRFLLGCAGGLIVGALVWSFGDTPVWPSRPVGPLWRAVPPLVGAVVVALSLGVEPGATGRKSKATEPGEG